MFNKSFANMRRDLSSGQGLGVSIFSGKSVTKNDLQHIRDFETAMKNGSTTAQAWQKHMTGCTVAAKQQAKQCLMNKKSLSTLINSLDKTTVSSKAAALGVQALSTALNIAISMGVSFAIQGAIKLIDNLVHAQEKATEKTTEAIAAYQDTGTELQSLQSELDETSKRIDELNAKNSLTVVEQEELNKLTSTNNELERQIKLKQALAQSQKEEMNESAKKSIGKKSQQSLYVEGEYNDGESVDRIELAQQYVDKLKAIDAEIADLENKQIELDVNSGTYKMYANRINILNNRQRPAYEKPLSKIINDLQAEDEGLLADDPESKNLLDRLNSLYDNYIDYKIPVTDTNKEISESFDEVSDSVNKVADTFNAKFSRLDNSGMLDSFKMLKEAMDELSDDGDITYSTIAEISDTFKYAVPNIEDYTKVLLDSSSTAEEMRQAIISLTEEYINHKIAAGHLSDADENMIQAMLDEAGIANSAAVAHDMVRAAKLNNAIASIDLSDTTGQSIEQFRQEAIALGLTETAITTLCSAFATAQSIMTAAENNGAIARLTQLGIELNAIQSISDAYNALGKAGYTKSEQSRARQRVENGQGSPLETAVLGMGDAREKINGLIEQLKGANTSKISTTPQYKPSDKKDKKDKSKDNTADKSKDNTADKVKDINDQLNDLAKSEALDALKYKFDQIEQSVEKLDTTISQLETTLDLTAEDDYISKIGTVGKQMEYASQKTELLRNEFSQLQSEKYISADMANEIASRMKSVADSIAENRKNIIEYGKNITEYYMSALTSVGKLSKETIDESTDLFERNVKTLSEGGLTGLQFNLSPTVPESAYEIQRAENESLEDEMRRYYDAVAEMQKIALDMQYQETVADNARKRQDLLDSLNEAYASQQSYSSSTIGLQKATNNTIKAEQQATNAQTSAVQEADYAKKENTQEVFVESIMDNWKRLKESTENMFIVAPKVDNDSWDKLAEDIEDKVKKIGQSFSDFDLPRGGMDGALSSATRGTTEKSTTGNGIVDTAMKYLGVPYVWGGTSPSGFDCSGFTYYVFGKNGKTIPRTAQSQYRGGQAVSRTALSPGDLVFFKGAYGTMTNPGHVAIYIGDNKIIEAPRTGEKIKIDYLSSKFNYVGARRYAKGTRNFPIFGRKVNGIAGENYKDEMLMHKKTGEITKINEPTFIDTNEYDVVGEDTTARVLKQYKTGTPTTDKEILDYIKRASDETGVPANIIMAVMDMETGYIWNNGLSDSKNTTSYGYMALNSGGALSGMDSERRQKATTDKYTNVLEGAKVLAAHYKTYGNWQTAIARYNGSGEKADDYGAEVWATANSDAFKKAVESLGSISETVKEIRKDFKTQIQEMINGVKSSATAEDSNKWEDDLLEYIKDETADSKKSTETYVENFEKLAQYQKDSETLFKDIDEQLLQAVGTPDFASVREQGNQQIQDYIAAIMGMQVDMETAQIKDQFAYAKNIQKVALKRYNERKENGATADELLVIANAYSEITSQVNELSDSYVDAIKAETDFLSNNAQNKMKKYADELSWINDEWDELERKLEKTDDEKDLVLQDNLFKAELENLNKQKEVYIRQQREAHQNRLDLYDNEEYSPIFDRFDIESWFDANGEITSQFNDDVARMGAYDETSHLVPLMNQLVELIKTYKQSWYEAADAIVDVEDNIQDVKDAQEEKENNRMLARVDKYVEYQERLMEALDFEKSMNDAVSTAKSSYYDFIDSLREEQNSIDTQLKKNMQLDDWLSEDTRKQLFNLDDYNEETKEINRLQEQAQRLYENYQNDISNLSEQDAYLQESITAEYNKRTEALQDQLSIAKQQLQVKKDEAAFENALKERDTQIILGNRVQNVADPENLSNLAEAKAQSELELDNLKAKSVEAEDIRDMERISDDLAKEKAARENMVAMINEASDEYKIALANFIEPIELITAKLNSLAKYNPVDMINGDNSDEIYQSFDPEKIGTGYNFDYDYSDGVWVNDTAHIAGLEKRSMYEAAKARLRNQHDYKALTDGRYSDKVFDLYNSDLSYDKNANFLHKFFKPSEAETFFKEFDVGNAKLKRMVDKTGEDVESIYKRIDLIEKYPQLKQQTRNTDNPIFKLMDIYRTLGGFMNDGLTKTYNTGKTTEYHINTINIKESAKDMDSLLTQIATQAAAGIEPAYSTIKNQR